jgi:hypothetical protein
MRKHGTSRNPLFAKRWFPDEVIITCVRWFSLELPGSRLHRGRNGNCSGTLDDSALMTRGTRLPGALSALRKKRLAAALSRSAVSRKSIVWPV